MIKVNGYRIEIPDVEANFRKLPYIKDLVIFEKKEKEYKNYLVAVISLIEEKKEIQIRSDLEKYLFPYMIPRKICILKNLPKNSNGKLDRSAIVKNFK
jgi:acyl-coenzyme A synthetase/AMP-(fatty) acid ligase